MLQVGGSHHALGTVIGVSEIAFSIGCFGKATRRYAVSGAV